MASAFEQGSAVTSLGDGRFAADIPDGWQQGRGAFGGLVLGTLLRAMEATEDDRARVTRSLSGELCGPVLPGPVEIHTTTLRRGNNLSNLDAQMIQNGEVLARASAVLSTPRSVTTTAYRDPVPPVVAAAPDWREMVPLALPSPPAPVFTRHLEFRSHGPLPFSGGDRAEVYGYVRMRSTPTRIDGPALIGLLDSWWPALFGVESGPRMMATVCFTAQLLVAPGSLAPEVPLFHTARISGLRDGFFVEFRELWSGDRLVAMNQQTFAVLK